MIKIKVNGNRSDITGYLSYYSTEVISDLLEIDESEIIFESNVNDYFKHGDLSEEVYVEVKVTMPNTYKNQMNNLTNVIVKFVSYFTNSCRVYYELVNPKHIYIYRASEVEEETSKTHKVEIDHDHECNCGHHHHAGEVEEHECTCDEHGCSCTDE